MKGKLINLKGQVFGALTVVRRSYPWETPGYTSANYRCKTRQARWVCQCVCGCVKIIISQNLRKGDHKCNCKPLRGRAARDALAVDFVCAGAGGSRHNARPDNCLEDVAVDLAGLTRRSAGSSSKRAEPRM